mmetsp:Transcript_9388/g.19408  ORF Transcript_9388/g.19408 Transcript_9388/m.19408 type:complete len:219 (-) Transcript_9388:151-807(-)
MGELPLLAAQHQHALLQPGQPPPAGEVRGGAAVAAGQPGEGHPRQVPHGAAGAHRREPGRHPAHHARAGIHEGVQLQPNERAAGDAAHHEADDGAVGEDQQGGHWRVLCEGGARRGGVAHPHGGPHHREHCRQAHRGGEVRAGAGGGGEGDEGEARGAAEAPGRRGRADHAADDRLPQPRQPVLPRGRGRRGHRRHHRGGRGGTQHGRGAAGRGAHNP